MYGLIGKHLEHSFSPDYFNKKFSDDNLPEVYRLFPLPEINFLPQLITSNPDLKGLNITNPYKMSVIPYLDELSEDAAKIGAVNVIKINRENGKIYLKGYNTDYKGCLKSLQSQLTSLPQNALILGTGGASKALMYALEKLGIHPTLVSRNPDNNQISYNDITESLMIDNKLIINTTPLGMFPETDTFPPIPYDFITPAHFCFDLIYNPPMTKFLVKSKAKGANVKNGYEMLLTQAEESWKIWNEVS